MTAVPVPVVADDRLLPAPRSTSREVGYWAMAAVCVTEGSLFALLLAGYFYLGVGSASWPPAGIDAPKLALPALMTILLVASSVAMWWAEHGIRNDQRGRLRLGLAVAILLGIAFLVVQGVEYHDKLQHFRPVDGAYPSIFYTITGFHGMHVLFGVLLMIYGETRALAGHFDGQRHLAVKNIALYWHFVDGVWLVIFTCLYLSPHFT